MFLTLLAFSSSFFTTEYVYILFYIFATATPIASTGIFLYLLQGILFVILRILIHWRNGQVITTVVATDHSHRSLSVCKV